MERLTKRLMQMKLLLYGDGEKEVDKEKGLVRRDLCLVCVGCALCLFVHWLTQHLYISIRSNPQELAQHIIGYNMMPLLLDHFTTLPFEARKDAAMIFSNMAKHNTAGTCVRACMGWMARSALLQAIPYRLPHPPSPINPPTRLRGPVHRRGALLHHHAAHRGVRPPGGGAQLRADDPGGHPPRDGACLPLCVCLPCGLGEWS